MNSGYVVGDHPASTIAPQSLLLVAVAAAWLAGIVLDSFFSLPLFALLVGTIAAFLFTIPLWHDTQGRLTLLLIGCLLLGACRYALASPIDDPQAISAFMSNTKVLVRGDIADEPKIRGHERILVVDTQSLSKDAGFSWQDVHGKLEVATLGSAVESPYDANYSDSIELQGKLQPPSPHTASGIFASMTFPRVQIRTHNTNPLFTFFYHLRLKLARIIAQALPQPYAALLIALLLSLHSPALKAITPVFNETGTAHLIAPSGFKVTVLAGLVLSSTSWLYKARKQENVRLLPAQKRRGWRRWLATTLVLFSIFAYTLLSGSGPAALRAGSMGILLVLAPRIGRTYNIYSSKKQSVL